MPTMELVKVDIQNAVQIFAQGGLDAVLDGIEAQVRSVALDVSTVTGRDEIRSIAYQVARTKTALDAEGKKLTEGWRESAAKVNAERKRATERLDKLAEEVRAPLTAFENKEKARVAAHDGAIREISALLSMIQPGGALAKSPSALLEDHLEDYAKLHNDRQWEEFTARATQVRLEVTAALTAKIEATKAAEAEQAELARLRAAEEERKRKERDEAIAAQAAEAARIQAERKAADEAEAERRRVSAEAERVRAEHERAQREAEAKAKKAEADRVAAAKLAEENRQREEDARVAAEKRAKEAEAARLAAAIKAESDRTDAEHKAAAELKAAKDAAEKKADEAIQRERERVAKEQADAEAARLKREADAAHVAKIRAEVASDIRKVLSVDPGQDDRGDHIANALLAGQIRHVKVSL